MLSYYLPGRGYQKTFAEPIALAVGPRPAVAVPDNLGVLAAPASFYELADGLGTAPSWFAFNPWAVAAWLLVPPLGCILAVRAWRAAFPDEAEAFAATAAGGAAGAGPAPARCDRAGLADRQPVPRGASRVFRGQPTPEEVRRLLRGRGVSEPLAREFERFFAACDAVRFAVRARRTGRTFVSKPHGSSNALEAEPCVA